MPKGTLTYMQDPEIRKTFGRRLKEQRKQKKWTQAELAEKLGVRSPQLNKYECGLHYPPAEKLVELSEILDTTVDFLLTGDQSDQRPLHNTRLLERFRAIESFDADDQAVVLKLIDAMIVKHKVAGALEPIKKKKAG